MKIVFVDGKQENIDMFSFLFKRKFKNTGIDSFCFSRAKECLDFLADGFDERVPKEVIVVTSFDLPDISGLDMISELNLIASDWNIWGLLNDDNAELKAQAETAGVKTLVDFSKGVPGLITEISSDIFDSKPGLT